MHKTNWFLRQTNSKRTATSGEKIAVVATSNTNLLLAEGSGWWLKTRIPASALNTAAPTLGFRERKAASGPGGSQGSQVRTFSRQKARAATIARCTNKKTTICCVFYLTTSLPLCYLCGVALGSGAQPVMPSDPDVHRDHDSPQFRCLLLVLAQGGPPWQREMLCLWRP